MSRRLFVIMAVFIGMLAAASNVFAATVKWDGGGGDLEWNTNNNWDGNLKPTASDDVIIDDTYVAASQAITATTTNIVYNSLSISSAAYSHSLAISVDASGGSVTIGSGGTLNAGARAISCSGNWNATSGTFTDGTSTVTFTGTSGTISITPGGTDENHDFYNITFNDAAGTATYQLQGALDVNNDLTVTDGILDTKSGSNYAITVARDFLQNAGRCTARSSTITVARHFTAKGTELSTQYNSASLVLTGTGDLTYSSLADSYDNGFLDLTCGQSGNTTTLKNQLAIRGVLTIGSGTLTGSRSIYFIYGPAAPLSFNASSTLSVYSLRFLSDAQIPSLTNGYSCYITVSGSNTLTQTGNVVLNSGKSLDITGDGFANRTSKWKTDGYNLTVGSVITVGTAGDTAAKTLDASSGTGGTTTITVGGNWILYDTGTAPAVFTAGNSTVILNGTSQSITGTCSFYNLTKTVSSAATLTFDNTDAQTVTNNLTLGGASGQRLSLRSNSTGNQWSLNVQAGATYSLDYLDVKDSDASGGIQLTAVNSIDSGNNLNWNLGGAEGSFFLFFE